MLTFDDLVGKFTERWREETARAGRESDYTFTFTLGREALSLVYQVKAGFMVPDPVCPDELAEAPSATVTYGWLREEWTGRPDVLGHWRLHEERYYGGPLRILNSYVRVVRNRPEVDPEPPEGLAVLWPDLDPKGVAESILMRWFMAMDLLVDELRGSLGVGGRAAILINPPTGEEEQVRLLDPFNDVSDS